jgi:phytoene dehydrogenase-like protein
MLASTAAAGGELFRDEGATAWLAGSAAHGGLGPGAAGGAALAIGLKFLAHAVGWGFPAGGAQRITDVLVERLAELGGQIRCGAPVESVLVRGARTCGVRVQGGEEIAAPAVVLAISASAARRLLPDDGLPGRLMRRLETWRHALGTVKADYALSGPVPWTSHEARRSAVVHVAGELGEIFAAHEEARAGGLPDRPVLIVGQHSLHDDSRAPAGGHTLYVYTHVPGDGSFTRQEAAASIETQLERFAPGFRSLILKRALRLPGDLERENASLVGGDLTGGSCELDQQLIFRPAPELFRGRTPLRGLYLAGSSIHPGPGVHGVSGAAAARALLADRRPLRRLARGALGSRRSAD